MAIHSRALLARDAVRADPSLARLVQKRVAAIRRLSAERKLTSAMAEADARLALATMFDGLPAWGAALRLTWRRMRGR
jgi:hypothetical protein